MIDYEPYATHIQSLGMDPVIVALDEYGLSVEFGRQLEDLLASDGDLDLAIAKLRDLDVDGLSILMPSSRAGSN